MRRTTIAGAPGVATADPVAFARRRAAAYQAYFEQMPISPDRLQRSGEIRLFRRIGWGDLLTLHMLDTRQHRTPHARGGRSGSENRASSVVTTSPTGGGQERR